MPSSTIYSISSVARLVACLGLTMAPLTANALPIVLVSGLSQAWLLFAGLVVGSFHIVVAGKRVSKWQIMVAGVIGFAFIFAAGVDTLEERRIHQKRLLPDEQFSSDFPYTPYESLQPLIESDSLDATVVLLTAMPIPPISGLNHFYYRDADAIRTYIESHDSDTVLFASESLNALGYASEWLRGEEQTLFVPLPAVTKGSRQASVERTKSVSYADDRLLSSGSVVRYVATIPGHTEFVAPLNAHVFDLYGALFKSSKDLRKELGEVSSAESAILYLPFELREGVSYPLIERFISHVPQQSVQMIGASEAQKEFQHSVAHYYQDNFYGPSDVHAAVGKGLNSLVVCFTESCRLAVPAAVRAWLPSESVLSLQGGLIDLNPGLHETLADLASRDRLIFVAENAYEWELATRVALEVQRLGAPVVAFTGAPQRLFISAKSNEIAMVVDDDLFTGFLSKLKRSVFGVATYLRIESSLHSIIALGAIGLLVGLMGRLGGGPLCLSLMGALVIYLGRYELFNIAPSLFRIELLPPLGFGLITGLMARAAGLHPSWVVISFFALLVTLYSVLLSGVVTQTVVLSSLLGSIFGRIFWRKRKWCRADTVEASAVGPKARYTLPMIGKWRRGWLLFTEPQRNKLPFLIWPWLILRSNHVTPEESDGAGVFSTYRMTQRNARAVIAQAFAEAQQNTELATYQIQFWLQPYLPLSLSGVARSLTQDRLTHFSIAIGRGTEVTDGVADNYQEYSRYQFWIPWRAFRVRQLLKRAERVHNGPVMIEFGFIGPLIFCLQVRPLQPNPSVESESVRRALFSQSKPKLTGCDQLDVFDQSIIVRLYGYQIFYQGDSLYSLPAGISGKPPSADALISMLGKYCEIKPGGEISERDLEGVLKELERIAERLLSIKRQRGHAYSDAELGKIVEYIQPYVTQAGGPIITHIDLLHTGIISILHSYASAMIDKSGMAIDRAKTLEAHRLDIPAGPRLRGEHTSELVVKRWEVVGGAFDGQLCTVDEVMRRPISEREGCIVVCDHFPLSHLSALEGAGGVVSRYGSPLSHLAQYCLYKGIPCRIGAGWEHFN